MSLSKYDQMDPMPYKNGNGLSIQTFILMKFLTKANSYSNVVHWIMHISSMSTNPFFLKKKCPIYITFTEYLFYYIFFLDYWWHVTCYIVKQYCIEILFDSLKKNVIQWQSQNKIAFGPLRFIYFMGQRFGHIKYNVVVLFACSRCSSHIEIEIL